MSAKAAKKELRRFASKEQARIQQRFFKTGPGEYAEGDVFIGVRVPQVREVVKRFAELSTEDLITLLQSKVHEERLLALLILVHQFSKASSSGRKERYELYLRHTDAVNNWDLVDLSADKIVGEFLLDRSRKVLYRLAKSPLLWERRIAVVATYAFIRRGELGDTFCISAQLLNDEHDLMHKACGWMLREAGKRDQPALEKFLKQFGPQMPRTMLRYAIERFPETKRQRYLRSTRSGGRQS